MHGARAGSNVGRYGVFLFRCNEKQNQNPLYPSDSLGVLGFDVILSDVLKQGVWGGGVIDFGYFSILIHIALPFFPLWLNKKLTREHKVA